MSSATIIKHKQGAPMFRIFGLGPNMVPVRALNQLKILLQENSSWAKHRELKDLKKMLSHSSTVITLWSKGKLIGFGRATSDSIYRAVLWDVIISEKYQRHGLGKLLINTFLDDSTIRNVERIYIMTTNCKTFYESCGFKKVANQFLLVKTK